MCVGPSAGGEGSAPLRPLSHEDGDGGQLPDERDHQGRPRGARRLPGGRRPDPGDRGVKRGGGGGDSLYIFCLAATD